MLLFMFASNTPNDAVEALLKNGHMAELRNKLLKQQKERAEDSQKQKNISTSPTDFLNFLIKRAFLQKTVFSCLQLRLIVVYIILYSWRPQ
jgi:hypothetical protein